MQANTSEENWKPQIISERKKPNPVKLKEKTQGQQLTANYAWACNMNGEKNKMIRATHVVVSRHYSVTQAWTSCRSSETVTILHQCFKQARISPQHTAVTESCSLVLSLWWKFHHKNQPGQPTNQKPIPKIIKHLTRNNKEEKRTIWKDYKDWEYKITNTGPEKYKNKHHEGYKKSLGSSHQTQHNLDFFF